MPQTDISGWLQFALQQMAAESYLNGFQFTDSNTLIRRLKLGNNNTPTVDPDLNPDLVGKTRFISSQAQEFVLRYQIVDHHANDATGFSATLMRDTTTGEYTLSFRSLEYQNQAAGGDWERDGQGGAAGEIAGEGFALGQLVSMERYYQELKNSGALPVGAVLNVTGYSLGGHLATIFTELHTADVQHTYTFNAAGRGLVGGVTPEVTETTRIQQLIDAMDAKFVEFDPTGMLLHSGDASNIYQSAWYQQASEDVAAQFGTTGTANLLAFPQVGGLFGGVTRTDGAFQKITQFFGSSVTGGDVQLVANSGVHGPVQAILIEGQPLLESLPSLRDYGNAHSMTLLVDSLSLQVLYETIDPDLTQTDIENIFKAASAARADTVAFAVEEHTAEGDTLERALDALRTLFVPTASDTTTDFNDDTGGFGDLGARTEFYTHLAEVQAAVAAQTFSIEPLVQVDNQGQVVPRLTAAELIAAAHDPGDSGLAYRYALRALNPFVIIGVDYAGLGHASNGVLALEDPANGFGEMTDQYLTDRAAFLLAKLDLTLNNQQYPSDLFAVTHYHDIASGVEVPAALLTIQREYLFGGANPDTLDGHDLTNDHLYGSAGNDLLHGFGSDDYLQGDSGDDWLDGATGSDRLNGGLGFDTYVLNADGSDTVNDRDDLGRLLVNGQLLSGGIRRAGDDANTFHSTDNTIIFVQSGTTLTINGQLTVANWEPGDLGVTLRDLSALPTGVVPVIDYNNGYSTEVVNLSPGPVEFNGSSQWLAQFDGPTNYVVQGNYGPETILGDGIHTTVYAQNQQIAGGDGSDQITGDFQDRLYGEGGDDLIRANWGADVVYGGAGRDLIFGDLNYFGQVSAGTYDDYMDGGSEQDTLNGMAGNDVLLGGTGDDELFGDDYTAYTQRPAGNDYLNGGDGNDGLYAGLGDDALYGGIGNDRLFGDNLPGGEDYYVWTERPWIIVSSQEEYFQGYDFAIQVGASSTLISTNGGKDYLEGGEGDDLLQGDGGDDVLLGGADHDTLYGDDLTLNGVQQGNDLLDGGSGNDTLYGGGGHDTLLGGSDNDTLIGDFSDDPLGGDDILDGGAGNDVLQGERGNDVLSGGTEDDQLFGQIGDDVLYGGAGVDTLQGDEGNDLLYGGTENDLLFGQAGNDFLSGDGGSDVLQGGDDADTLLGGDGDDQLWGNDGDDLIVGGAGTDILRGGAGNDTYVFHLGDDIEDIDDTEGVSDRLVFGAGITSNMVSITNGSLLLRVGNSGDEIHIQGFDIANPTVPTSIEFFEFADGTSLTHAELIARGFDLFGTTGDDVLNTGELYRRAYGLDGADQLIGGTADNTLDGGAGIDELWGGAGHDILLGGSEGDTLYGEEGSDQLTGGDGNDTLSGGDGDDTLDGGTGADVLAGDAGHDVYVLAVGDGIDTLHDVVTGTAYNAIRFGAGILSTDLTYVEAANTLTITYSTTGDQVQLAGFDRESVTGSLVVSTLQFADGSVVNLADLFPGNRAPTVVNPIADQIVQEDAPFSVVIPANTFADQDIGDVLTLSASLADGSALPAWLSFNPLTRTFSGTPDDAQVGIVSLKVTATDSGNLSVTDTFNLAVSNVNEAPTVATILADQTARETEAFSFVVPAGTFTDEDLGDTLTYSATLDTGASLPTWLSFDTVTRTFSGTPQGGDVGAINVRVTATDATGLGVSDVFAVTVDSSHTFTGTPGNDSLIGTAGDDVLNGLGGGDVLNGLAGNDVLDGGNENDVLDGGAGSDRLSGGDGDDSLYVDDADSFVSGGAGYDTVYVIGSSGVSLNVGTSGVEVAYGGMGNDYFSASGSSIGVSIDAGAGHDTLVGGNEVDILTGGTGDDTYLAIYDYDYYGTFDTIIEQPGEGMDWVKVYNAFITDPLPDNVEGLQLYYTLALYGYGRNQNGTGNELNNTIYGNEQINTLRGGAGDDYLHAGGNITIGAYDVLYGEEGNDTLTGSVRVEMYGGPGDDTYILTAGLIFKLSEATNEGIDTIQSPITYVITSSVENLTLTGFDPINGTGNTLDNVIIGNSAANVLTGGDGNDTLDGRAGSDTLTGGNGNDTYGIDHVGDTISEANNGGTDVVIASISYTLGATLENLTLIGTAAINGTGNSANNVLDGSQNSAANVLTGGTGNDTYIVYGADTIVEGSNAGTDTIQIAQTYTLTGNLENLTLSGTGTFNGTGNTVDNIITGNSAANTLTGLAGNDTLNGGGGADTLIGGIGNDTYVVDNTADVVTENAAEGTDTVQSSITWTLGANLENLTLTGAAAINGTGNTLNNTINGNSGANVLDGGSGADAMAGGAGDDTYLVDNTSDTVTEAAAAGIDTVRTGVTVTLAANVENLVLTGSTAISATGNGSDNVLDGSQNSAVNVLSGGSGNDTYIVGSGDTISEASNGGTDTVHSALTYTLGTTLENLILTGSAAINGTGNTANNILTGNSGVNTLTGLGGNDTLNGGAGADTLIGGIGNDTYVVNDTGVVITENAAEGTDIIQSSVTCTLAANVENLTLTGSAAINGTGNALNNTINGNSGANVLDGTAGADAMVGGAGDDTYLVDNTSDTVTEASSSGIDTVQSSITYTIGSNLEYLTLTGTAAINGTGNTLNNVLDGSQNSAANVLTGGTGNDTYTLGSGDTIVEASNGGTDTVQSAASYVLGSNLENLTLTGTAAINGTGNALNNTINGNSGSNVLDGGAGADTMSGFGGDDTYIVDNAGDTVSGEWASFSSNDLVNSSVTFSLSIDTGLENLTLTGTSAINGTGNYLDNVLIGNNGVNVLTGFAGNDTYVVGTGDSTVENSDEGTDTVQSSVTWTLAANVENLTLTGTSAINGTGNASNNTLAGNSANNVLTGLGGDDTYLYNRGGGQDTVVDNSGGSDAMLFGTTINPLDLVLSRQANDLRLAIHGGTEQVTIQNWYTSPTTNQVETIQAGNGQTLLSTQVDQLIQAMAGFTQQTGLTWDQAIDQQPTQVQAVLAASWQ